MAALTSSEVTSAYRSILKREPDPDGIAYWLYGGHTLDDLISGLIGSSEFAARFTQDSSAPPNIAMRIDQMRNLIGMKFVTFDYEAILETQYRKWISPGDTVIDIGAHVGRHLRALIECVGNGGRAYAFEPLPFAFQELRSRFSARNVTIHNCAIGERASISSFTYATGTPEESGLRERIFNNPVLARPTCITVDVRTLDSFTSDFSGLHFIKIDTEGGEIGCLRGATRTIDRFRPVISVEYGRAGYSIYGNTSESLYDFAESCGYAIFDIFVNELHSRKDWGHACDSIYWDYFMVPIERKSEFVSRVARA